MRVKKGTEVNERERREVLMHSQIFLSSNNNIYFQIYV